MAISKQRFNEELVRQRICPMASIREAMFTLWQAAERSQMERDAAIGRKWRFDTGPTIADWIEAEFEREVSR